MFFFYIFCSFSDQLVFVFPVDKLITGHLPHICMLLFFFSQKVLSQNYQHPRIKNDQFQQIPDQLGTKVVTFDNYLSLYATICDCLSLFTLFETICTIHY